MACISNVKSVPGAIRTLDPLLRRQPNTLKLLNKLTASELAELSKLSKSYVSQVKHGKCLPSQRLFDILVAYTECDESEKDYFALFIESRNAMGVSPKTIRFYKERLLKFLNDVNYLKASRASQSKALFP